MWKLPRIQLNVFNEKYGAHLFYKEVLIYDSLCPSNGIKVDDREYSHGRNARTIPLGASFL